MGDGEKISMAYSVVAVNDEKQLSFSGDGFLTDLICIILAC